MQIVDNKILLVRTKNPAQFSLIPKSKVLDEDQDGATMAVFWGLDEARVLKNLGVKDVPSPIVGRYNWPGRYKPMAHQKETSSFLTLHRRALCLNEPGTGKTLAALWAADYLMTRGEVRRVLIVCPLSIMQSAWLADLQNSIIHRSAIVCHHSSAARRIEMIQGDYEIVISNYDGLEIIGTEVRNDGRFDLIIVDEANKYQNTQTKSWKTLASLIRPDTYLWLMTGSPAAQSPVGAYGLAKLVNPTGVPKFQTAWRDKVMQKVSMFRWEPRKEAKALVHEALQPAIRYKKTDCLDLPPVTTTTREVVMTPQQTKYYRLIKEQMMASMSGTSITAVNAGIVVNKLLQISAGAARTDDGEVVEFDCAPRLKVIDEVLEETDRKVLIFALYRASIDTVLKHLEARKIGCAAIHGDVSLTKRTQIIEDFQNRDNIRVLVMQPQATAHGITLTAADTVVFYGPLMSVEQYIQCIARADRKGQTSDKVTVVHLQGSPVEARMFKALSSRVNEHALLVGMFANGWKDI